jgi:phosphoribosylanthranilate isomerase
MGGTGLTFDWAVAATAVYQNAQQRKLIAAGGLTPANVAQAISTLRPWGIDAVSGVEAAPGRKNPVKVRAFVTNARSADAK